MSKERVMSYTKPRHEGRLALLSLVRDAFASLHVHGDSWYRLNSPGIS